MRQLASMFVALALLVASPCRAQVVMPSPTPMIFASAVDGHPVTVSAQWGKYIQQLQNEYTRKRYLYLKKSNLHRFIYKEYSNRPTKDGKPTVLPYNMVCMYAYASTEYPKKCGLDSAWMKGVWTHESHWDTSSICRAIRVGDKIKMLPINKWSYGTGQIEANTGRIYFEKLGFKGFDPQWLCDFPLMNLDVSCKIFKYKLKLWKTYRRAIQAYNGGDNGWRDGRSKPYFDSIRNIVNKNWYYWNLNKLK